jgi:signal transduction histidine kinase
MLHEFIAANRREIIARCRTKVATRAVPPPTEAEIDSGVPLFLDQLGEALRSTSRVSTTAMRSGAARHGQDLLLQGYTVSQVVHDYGDVCQSITELAVESDAPITTNDFRTLNQCLDDAIASAVTQFGRGAHRRSGDGEEPTDDQRLGFLAHELRNLVNTAMVAFDVLKTGNVGVGGSTGNVLHRSLVGLRDLVDRSLAEVRLTQGVQNRERFLLSAFIDEIGGSAALEASARGLAFTVLPVMEAVAVEADRQILAAVVANLLQNAFKFTRPHSSVTLSVGASTDRVFIEVQDECGGLPGRNADELFHPFEQRGADRTGVGLGLAFCRWAVGANRGRIHTRNIPGSGCVFTVDLPRVKIPVGVAV